MPIEYHIDEARRRVVTTINGDFTMNEIVATIDGAIRDPRFRPGFVILSDHTAIGEPLTSSQAKEMIAHLESLAERLVGTRWAVVTSKPASYGMLRMVSVMAERVPLQVRVFESHAEAEAWLSSSGAESS